MNKLLLTALTFGIVSFAAQFEQPSSSQQDAKDAPIGFTPKLTAKGQKQKKQYEIDQAQKAVQKKKAAQP